MSDVTTDEKTDEKAMSGWRRPFGGIRSGGEPLLVRLSAIESNSPLRRPSERRNRVDQQTRVNIGVRKTSATECRYNILDLRDPIFRSGYDIVSYGERG